MYCYYNICDPLTTEIVQQHSHYSVAAPLSHNSDQSLAQVAYSILEERQNTIVIEFSLAIYSAYIVQACNTYTDSY